MRKKSRSRAQKKIFMAGMKTVGSMRRCFEKVDTWCGITYVMILVFGLFLSGQVVTAYADELTQTPTPTVTEFPEEKSDEGTTIIKDGVPDSYASGVTVGLSTTVEGLVNNEEEAVNSVVRLGMLTLEKIIHYIPYIGIGIFLIGVAISVISIINKGNRRWGIRMAIVTSIVLYLAYIFLILLYDINFMGRKPTEVIRPESLDYYGEVYFDVWEEVLNAERLAGLADKTLSKDVIAILVNFYQESAFDIGIVTFGFGLLLSIIMRRNLVLKKWARLVLCIVVPIVLYAGYWYISRLN